jgi:transcriptional regulator with XRE-family HTH domain
MINDAATIGARLRKLRVTQGLTQTALAESLGVTQSAWTQYETGARKISIEVAGTVVARFGVTLDWIYMGDPSGLPMRLVVALTT